MMGRIGKQAIECPTRPTATSAATKHVCSGPPISKAGAYPWALPARSWSACSCNTTRGLCAPFALVQMMAYSADSLSFARAGS